MMKTYPTIADWIEVIVELRIRSPAKLVISWRYRLHLVVVNRQCLTNLGQPAKLNNN